MEVKNSLAKRLDLDLNSESYDVVKLIGTLLICFIIVQVLVFSFYVVTRFLRIRCSAKIQPDASKAILITGATSGLGLCLAKRLHKLGFTIFACYYSELEPGFRELIELGIDEKGMFLVPLDVSSQESISKCNEIVELHLREFNLKLHALVNNAGCSPDSPFEWLDRSSMNRVIDTNLTGCIRMCRQFVRRIIIDKGRFINVSSIVAWNPMNTISIYGATKCALANFSEALHYDLEPYGSGSYSIFLGNSMASTNTVFTTLRAIQESLDKLSVDEKTFFAKSIKEQIQISQGLVEFRIKQAHYDIDQIEQNYNINLDFLRDSKEESESKNDFPASILFGLKHLICKPFHITAAAEMGNEGFRESKAFVYSFVAAILLKNPPKRLYAGSTFHTFIAGPLSELLPCAWLS